MNGRLHGAVTFPIAWPVTQRCPSSTGRPTRKDARGIRRFREAYPDLRVGPGLVISPTPSVVRLSEEDTAIPWDLAPVR